MFWVVWCGKKVQKKKLQVDEVADTDCAGLGIGGVEIGRHEHRAVLRGRVPESWRGGIAPSTAKGRHKQSSNQKKIEFSRSRKVVYEVVS